MRRPQDMECRRIISTRGKKAGHFRILDAHLANRDYVLGERLTMGDIPIGAGTYRYMSLPIERPGLPNVEAWYSRLRDRDAYGANVMVPIS